MKKFLSKLSFTIDTYTDRIGEAVSWLTTILMIIICVDVALRHQFNMTETWIIELEWHLFSIIFLFGAAYTLLHDKHVRVDVFYERMTMDRQRVVNSIGILLFLIPWVYVVLNTSWDYSMNSFSFREGSSQPNGLPARYLIKFCIFLSFFLLLIQGISVLIRSTIRKK